MMNKKGKGLSPFIISFVLVILFSLFIFSFIGQAIETQNKDSEVLSSKYGLNQSKVKMEGVIEDFSRTSDNVFKQMGEDEPTAIDFLFLIFKGAFYIPKAFLTFIFSGVTVLTSSILFPSLGGSGFGKIISITTGLIFSTIIIMIVFLIVKAIRTGESER